jgi:hypothetical protein
MLVVAFGPALAQTSFLPDIAERGSVRLQMDALAHPVPPSAGGWGWKTPTATWGLGAATEVTGGISVITPASVGSPHLLLQIKRRWYSHSSGLAIAGGVLGLKSLSPRSDRDDYAYLFVTASRSLGRGTNVAGGLARIAGRDASAGESRWSLLLSGEQSLPVPSSWRNEGRHIAITGQWMSGHHFLSYGSLGVSMRQGRYACTVGYASGNRPQANHGPFVSLAYQLRK